VHVLFSAAALADTVAVVVHGVVGGRWASQQLRAVQLPASPLFGDGDVGRRVFAVTWHAVTGVFAVCAGTLYLAATGWVRPDANLLRFISALHVAVLIVGLSCFLRRLDALLGMVPPIFVTCMGTVALTSWIASRGV
jgi:hypothetical protein